MKDEINRDMILMGCKNFKELNRSKLHLEKIKKSKYEISKNLERLGTEAAFTVFS